MDDNTIILILCIINSILSVPPLILHCLGIHLLKRTQSYHEYQKIYLVQLSVMEILFLLVNNNLLLYLKITNSLPSFEEYLPIFVLCLIAMPWCNIMILLTLDRFAQIWFNIKYAIYVTKRRVIIALIVSWTMVVVLFIMMVSMKYQYKVDSYEAMHYVIQGFMALVMVSSLLSYSYIYYRLKRNKRKDSTTQLQRQGVFVPFWIVFTFFWLFLLPNIIQLVFDHTQKVMSVTALYFYVASLLLFDIGCLADVLIYILMSEKMRVRFYSLIGCEERGPSADALMRHDTTV